MYSNKKGFYKYINSKRKTMENVGPLLNGPLLKLSLMNSRHFRTEGKYGARMPYPSWKREHLHILDVHKAMGPE